MTRRIVGLRILMILLACAMLEFTCAKSDLSNNGAEPNKTAQPNTEKEKDKDAVEVIIANINGKKITMTSLKKEIHKVSQMQSHGMVPGGMDTEQIKRRALDSLIFTELAQEYADKNITVSEQEIADAIDKLRTHLKTDEEYQDYLKKAGYTEDTFRKEIARRLSMQKAFQQEVDSKAVFDEKKAREEYDAQKERFTIPEGIEVDHIYIHGKKEKEDEGKEKAEAIIKELKEVKNTAKLKDKTGIGIRTSTLYKDQDPELFNKITGLQPSEVSDIIEKDMGYHIFLVKKKIPEELMPFDKTKKWFQGKAKQERAKEWFEELKKGATIEIMLDKLEEKPAEAK
jgi:hypothetical protein